jgi:hypothetical protein
MLLLVMHSTLALYVGHKRCVAVASTATRVAIATQPQVSHAVRTYIAPSHTSLTRAYYWQTTAQCHVAASVGAAVQMLQWHAAELLLL